MSSVVAVKVRMLLLQINKGSLMLKNKSIAYIFGMITGASGSTVQEVKVVNENWNPVYVTSTD